MLKSEYRLKKRKEFNYIYKNGTVVSSNLLVLYCTHTPKRSLKIGFSVSKKVGKAIVRNKVKRRLRAILADKLSILQDNFAYIFVAKAESGEASFLDLKQNVDYIIKKSKMSKENTNV